MAHREARLERIEKKAEELRKLLLGCLLLSKEVWKEELLKSPDLLKKIDEAEDAFPDLSVEDKIERVENTLDVSLKRAASLFELMQAQSGKGEKG